MPCVAAPPLPLPELPEPLSVEPPPLPTPPNAGIYCCTLPIPPIPPIPIAISTSILTPAVIATLNGYVKQAVDFINSIPAKCPLE